MTYVREQIPPIVPNISSIAETPLAVLVRYDNHACGQEFIAKQIDPIKPIVSNILMLLVYMWHLRFDDKCFDKVI